MNDKRPTTLMVIGAAALLVFILGALLSFFIIGNNAPVGLGWYFFSFATGLTMIVMPCTLPLAFVIVPLSMGKGPIKGLSIALAFGIGVALTLSLYGIAAALVGQFAIGSLGAPLEVVKNWMYVIAGGFAYLFALGELGLIRLRMPTYTGAAPAFIQKQQDVIKALMLGLFLGNIGVGCPHPATPMLLTRIAVSGDLFYGWLLFLVHAVGRVMPLLLLAMLGIMGINALSWLVSKKDPLERATGWMMVYVAGFILVLGLFSHDWWVFSGQHSILEEFTQEHGFTGYLISKLNLAGAPHTHGIPTGTGLFGLPLALGNWVLVLLWIVPLWWFRVKQYKAVQAATDADAPIERKLFPLRLSITGLLTAFLVITVVYVLPDRFYSRAMMGGGDHGHAEGTSAEHDHAMMSTEASGAAMAHDHASMTAGGDHAGHSAMIHEESTITEGLISNLTVSPAIPESSTPAQLAFYINDAQTKEPITNLTVNHDKLIHVMGLRSDMNEFFHIHPDPIVEAPGVFAVDHEFSKPGTYKIWSEVTYDGTTHVIGHSPVVVEGEGSVDEKDVSFGTSVIAGNYQVMLHTSELVVNRESSIQIEIHDSKGQEVALENYLGVPMHMAIIKDDWSEFIHTHPNSVGGMDESMPHEHSGINLVPEVLADAGHAGVEPGHGVNFSAMFPTAGIYKVFAQFRPEGVDLPIDEAIVASFWIEVKEKPAFPFPPKIFLFVVSIVAMAGLSYVVKRYITVPEVTMKKTEETV